MSLLNKIKESFSWQNQEKEKTEEKRAENQVPKIKKMEPKTIENKDPWFESEAKLSVDLFKANGWLVIQSTIAGIKPEDLEITIQGDLLNIKGVRVKPVEENEKERSYFYQECYWGPFSRQIILPEEVDPSRIEASLKEGILTIRIPRIERNKKRKVEIKNEF
jgi:HSP20 family protein